MQRWIARSDGTAELPLDGVLHAVGPQGVFQDVIADSDKRVPSPLFFLEHVIVRLMLEFLLQNPGFEMRSQESHAIQLIGIQAQHHPNQVQMVGHETIRRAQESLARGGVQHQFAKRGMKSLVEPAFSSVGDGKRPVYRCVTLVVFARKARQIERPIQVWFIHDAGNIVCTRRRRNQPLIS